MPAIADTLRRFGSSLGLTNFRFNEHNIGALRIEKLGNLRFERFGNRVFCCLSRAFPPHDTDLAERALKAVAPHKGHPFSVRPGLCEENTLVLAVCLDEADFVLPNLERCITLLGEIMDSLEQV